jgi:two-component system, chemotaxis family, protein-glutamate methylesterase/glutaminase
MSPLNHDSDISTGRTPIKVLVVDDSRVDSVLIAKGLERDPGIQVIGTARSGEEALKMIDQNPPDVISLDIVMPGMDGVEFLKRLKLQKPVPVVAVSGKTKKGSRVAVEMLSLGAFDIVQKPGIVTLREFHQELRTRLKMAAHVDPKKLKLPLDAPISTPVLPPRTEHLGTKLIAIGASTGGIQALAHILKHLPPTLPGIVVVQHLLPDYTEHLASILDHETPFKVKVAIKNDRVLPGTVLLAPGNQHMQVCRSPLGYVVNCYVGEKVGNHCPSVNVLMSSVALAAGKQALGILLTGMGKDGAQGMLEMKEAGSINLVQDASTSIVFGMPKAAIDLEAAHEVLPLPKIPARVIRLVTKA